MPISTISAERIGRDLDLVAQFREPSSEPGFHRPTFSPSWKKACDYVAEQAQAVGCRIRRDAAGNLRASRVTPSPSHPVWLSGSHLDSVPGGGRFDGVAGVLVALELLRACPEIPLELIVFVEEEGTGFGTALIGSRLWTKSLTWADLEEIRSPKGQKFIDSALPFGLHRKRLETGNFGEPWQNYRGFVEVHVEQGSRLWKRNQSVAVVDAVNGRRQYRGTFVGTPNHAGSTRMEDRFDALSGAAELALALETLGRDLDAQSGAATLTMGSLDLFPNATNVIPGEARFTLDFRSRSAETLSEGDRKIRELLTQIGTRRGLKTGITEIENIAPQTFDPGLCRRLIGAGEKLGFPAEPMASGALHDACVLAPQLPSAMVFVASRDGLSHHPDEFSRTEDLAAACRLVAGALGESD